MLKPRTVLRQLLKLVDQHITKTNGNPLWRNYILKQYRVHRQPNEVENFMAIAAEYAELVRSVHANKRLLESYDITTEKDSYQREMVKKTAERVGFKIPDFPVGENQEQEQNQNKS